MKVLESEGFSVYIYDDEHPPPHCHVIFNTGEEIVVGLPLLDAKYGRTLKKKVRKFLEKNINLLADTWESKHPRNKKQNI